MLPRKYFIKLGGSLITDKTLPMHPLPEVIKQVAQELAASPERNLTIGNGAGSFGHYTVQAVDYKSNPADKKRIAAVRESVQQLNQLVVDHLQEAGLQVKTLPPHSFIHERSGKLMVNFQAYDQLLDNNLIPVVYGDVIDSDDSTRIIATEEVLELLAEHETILRRAAACIYATSVDGVLDANGNTVKEVPINHTITNYGVNGFDVTGGMAQKVTAGQRMLTYCDNVFIINGAKKGQLLAALSLQNAATRLSS